MKISLVTVSLNNVDTIRKTFDSVLQQSFNNYEYIVIDGVSTDGTVEVIKEYEPKFEGRMKWISEPDNGLYQAMNKGIKMATGDILGTINADDYFVDSNILQTIINSFTVNTDAVYADVQFVNENEKVVRYYSSKKFSINKFRFGFMPAHPSFYVYREYFNKYGFYKEDYKIASDFELMIRFLSEHKLKTKYIPKAVVNMRTGGLSNKTVKSRAVLNREIIRACRENDIKTNYLMVYLKYFIKVFEFIGN